MLILEAEVQHWTIAEHLRILLIELCQQSGESAGHLLRRGSLEVPNRPVFLVLSDAEGNFELELPARTRNVILSIGAPGFGFRILRVAVPPPEEALIIPVSSNFGTLAVDLPPGLDRARWDAPQAAIFHGGGYAGLFLLQDWAGFQGRGVAESENRYVIPSMEPGEYTACLCRLHELPRLLLGQQGDPDCARGYLSAGGELELPLAAADLSRYGLGNGGR